MSNPPQSQIPDMLMQEVQVGSLWDITLPVLTGVNWTVAPGGFWVVAGLPRSGKTDLLMLAGGLMPPLAGSYRLFGRETREFGEAELAERRAQLERQPFAYPRSQTPWQEIQRGMVDQLGSGMVLEPAVKYQRVAQKSVPRDSH